MTRPLIGPDWATNTNYGAGARPWNGQPNKTEPSAGVKAEGFDPENPFFADFINWVLNNHGEWIKYLDVFTALGVFGSGADGAADLDGINTYPWATLVSGLFYTINQDVNLTTLTVRGGISLRVAGSGAATYRIYCNDSCTVETSGVIETFASAFNNGSTPDPPNLAGTVAAGGTGGTGAAGAGGAGGSVTNAKGGNGAAGGAGSGGAAGAAGTVTAPAANKGSTGNSFGALMGHIIGVTSAVSTPTAVQGGAGGSAGGGNGGANTGGAGGPGGGVLQLAARTIHLAQATNIRAKGNIGASRALAGAGGGGGGGGGYVRIVCGSLQVDSGTMSAATNCPGGAGGTGGGTGGLNGSTGANGTLEIVEFGAGAAVPLALSHEESGNISVASGDTTKTATFANAFGAAPPSGGAYKFDFSIARTDGVLATPGVIITTLTTTSMTFEIIDDFQGVISWRAWI